jgi:hypothetical protein
MEFLTWGNYVTQNISKFIYVRIHDFNSTVVIFPNFFLPKIKSKIMFACSESKGGWILRRMSYLLYFAMKTLSETKV